MRRSSITENISTYLARRRDSRDSMTLLNSEGLDKEFIQRVMAKHFDNMDIQVNQVLSVTRRAFIIYLWL